MLAMAIGKWHYPFPLGAGRPCPGGIAKEFKALMTYSSVKPLRHPLVLKAGRRLRNTSRRKLSLQELQPGGDSGVAFSICALSC